MQGETGRDAIRNRPRKNEIRSETHANEHHLDVCALTRSCCSPNKSQPEAGTAGLPADGAPGPAALAAAS